MTKNISRTIEHWVGGAPYRGTSELNVPVYNPATGQAKANVAVASAADVDHAVSVATEAAKTWSQTSLATRTAVMFRMRELVVQNERELAELISLEHGKTIGDALAEVARGRETIDFACGINATLKGEFSDSVATDIDVHSARYPLGVVAGITPFNFPAMVPMWMHPIAIATGNTFILKPSERVPSAANYTAELYRQAGLPDGVFNVVHGDKDTVDAILDHPGISAVSFVGSTPVARYVQGRAINAGKRVQALGGANNHAIVMPDADMENAASHIVAAAYGSAGERCMAVPVAVAVGDAADALLPVLERKAREIVVGPGNDASTDMGPLISKDAQERVTGYIAEATAQGGTLVVDGRKVEVAGHEDGFFVGPTLVDHVTPDMSVYQDEVFGPLLAVVRVKSFDEALELTNSSPYGNGAAIFTADGQTGRRFAREVEAGMVGINVPVPVPVAYYSFGGWKGSLFGDTHVHGPEGVKFFTRAKVVTSRWPNVERPVSANLAFPTNN